MENQSEWSEVISNDNGKNISIRFFATWSGLKNPVKPQKQVDLIQAQALDVYYEFSFEKVAKREVISKFEKYRLEKHQLPTMNIDVDDKDVHFFATSQGEDNSYEILSAMSPEQVLRASEYIFVSTAQGGREFFHISRTKISSRQYNYNAKGKYQDYIDLFP